MQPKRLQWPNNDPMKLLYSFLLLGLAYLLHRVTVKTRGKGSWRTDQWLTRLQGALAATALLIWLL